MLATSPTVSSSIRWIVGTPSTLRRWTRAVVSTERDSWPCPARMLESAIEKQAAWAAASSSSGFVPSPSPNREAAEYSPRQAPSPTVSWPEPLSRSPCHRALPLRVAIAASLVGVEGSVSHADLVGQRLAGQPRQQVV